MKLEKIIHELERWAPPSYQESYDNSGLLIGHKSTDINGCLICLDSTEEVIDEAIEKGVNLIIAHHPIVFKGLKRFNGKNYVERSVIKAIKNDICIYAIHTNLDNIRGGVNEKISNLLGLTNKRILSPKSDTLNKLVFFSPEKDAERVKSALFKAGAGKIGNYKECSFSAEGNGTFHPLEGAQPSSGKKGETYKEKELRIEVLVKKYEVNMLVDVLKNAHPYEEVAYEIYPISNLNAEVGSGMYGELTQKMSLVSFLEKVKSIFGSGTIKYTDFSGEVSNVAVCGGSGGFLLGAAKRTGADVFITSDYKYHEFFDAEKDLSIIDIGHYESEQFTLELIQEKLKDKFPNFAARLTEVNTNPVKYF